jgi:transcriptional regulator with XRE-family HTH domain
MFGKYISHFRKSQGYTLSQFADRVGISKSYLSNIERELKQNPSIQVMERIAVALNIDLNDLLNNETNEVKAQYLEKEWIDFMNEFIKTGIDKTQIQEYKILVEFIKWNNDRKLRVPM